jgi:D-alanyl-lipoteichoic acid acyltransferase DltB (MBOAT superfamily)
MNFLFDSKYGGIYHWRLPCNFLALRIISFCIDRVTAHRKLGFLIESIDNNEIEGEVKQDDITPTTAEEIQNDLYSFTNYMAYILYSPLYIAGPIMNFDDFIQDITRTSKYYRSRSKNNKTNRGIYHLVI